jgi:D-arabinose 5-phosphate isomerase GutQ
MSDAAGRDTLLRTIALEADGLRALHAALGGDLGALVLDAVAAIRAAPGRVIVTGMGKSGHVGRKIAATMASTGTPAHFVHPAEASHGDLGMIGREDVVLALSWSGEAPELADIIAYTRRFEVKLVAITSRPGSALGGAADICLALPRMPEACPNGLAPTTSTTMQLALGDALAMALREEPHLPGALASSYFDDEGVATHRRDVVKDGVLNGYFLGAYSARKLGMKTTGNAGGAHNLILAPGPDDFVGMLGRMGTGLLVTEVLGHGVNLVTGDYSQGAAGYWVENGEITYPVHEITIAGNLKDMFRNVVAIGNDVLVRGSRQCGSILIEGMTVAGE